jgi:uncharacterized membrane protein YphA (DoxX/SURF4 family)
LQGKWRIAIIVLRLIVGGIFVYAAWTKLSEPWQLFAMNIDSYRVLPIPMVEFVARALPWFEAAIGLLVMAGIWLRISSTAVSLLLLVFFSLMVRAYISGMEINCGCFGTGEPISWKTLLRDGALLAAALTITATAFLSRRRAAA